VKTLILPGRYTSDSIALQGAAIEEGWQVERLPLWRPPARLRDADVAVYGEPLFGAVVAQELSLTLVTPPFDWLAALPRQHVLRDVASTTLDEARSLERRSFIKPASDKCFPAAVYEDGSGLTVSSALPGELPVLVSEPVTWNAEYRFFILDRAIAAYSIYSGRETSGARAFCERLLADSTVNIDSAVAIDVGEIAGRGWAVVEANAAWASGIYGCDPHLVLKVVAKACTRKPR
jgi:hypothetical protein